MIPIKRPCQDDLEIEFILIDFEGTLASDRRVHPKVKDKINLLAKRAQIYILAKSEREWVEESLKRVKATILYFKEGESSHQKLDLLHQLGSIRTVAIGNGKDDVSILEEAGLSISVLGKEGTFSEAMKKADIVFINILDALDFLLKPLRQKATLGS